MKRFPRSLQFAAAVLLLLMGTASGAGAQVFTLGSADDPMEAISSIWWKHEQHVELLGGVSLIGPQWRTMAGIEFTYSTPRVAMRLNGFLRGGIYGPYQEDFDHWYDVVRMIDFIRLDRPAGLPLFARAGPIERLRLGSGHLVESFHSWTAWEQRTVGLEAQWLGQYGDVTAFASDLRFNSLAGAHAALRPFGWSDNELAASVEVGASIVADMSDRSGGGGGSVLGSTGADHEKLRAFSGEISVDIVRAGPAALAPFVSYANYTNFGSGIAAGIDLETPNFADLLRLRLRAALYYSTDAFIPGYIGAFYPVSNLDSYIVDTNSLAQRAGVSLADAEGGTDMLSEFYLLLFDRVELWYFFRRHYGSQALSMFHARMAFTLPNGLRLMIGEDRGGLRSIFSLFGDLNDQTLLTFRADYPFSRRLTVHMRALYTYEQLGVSNEGAARYLVVRRFEPSVGFRLSF